jgi:hypothetical protein
MPETHVSPLPDDDLHDTGAGLCRGKGGADELVEREQHPLISAKSHAVRRFALQECHQRNIHRCPVFNDSSELHSTDGPADGASIDRAPDKEFATAPTRKGQKEKNKQKRREAFHNTTSGGKIFLQRFYTQVPGQITLNKSPNRAPTKIDVIPNTRKARVRACPELVEGNLLLILFCGCVERQGREGHEFIRAANDLTAQSGFSR